MNKVFSGLWTFVTLNYLYCDVMGLMDPGLLKQYLEGVVNKMPIDGGFLLGAAVLMEIPMAMVVLSLVLGPKANRVANMVAAVGMTLVQGATLLVGNPAPYYLFCSLVEIGCTVGIFIGALRWTDKGHFPAAQG